MTDDAESSLVLEPGGDTGKFVSPPQYLSVPESVTYHAILDHELTQLSNPETGMLGAFGFAGLGGALGLAPSAADAISKADAAIGAGGMTAVICCVFCTAAAIGCLALFAVGKWRNRGLATAIRKRPMHAFPGAHS